MAILATKGAVLFALAALVLAPWASAAEPVPGVSCPDALTQSIPPRPALAEPGGAFAADTLGLHGKDREQRIREQLLSGNIPAFLTQLVPVSLEGRGADDQSVSVVICVTPDYLAIGSNDDFLRIPMGLETAVAVAERFGFVLPTRRMVDVIYDRSPVRLKPQPMQPGAAMVSTDYFVRHNSGIEAQRARARAQEGQLTAGHKKDLVLTNRLREKPGRVAIYGWHRRSGDPIQPLSTVHGAAYADYSHGVRLVSKLAYLDGKPTPIASILEDPQLAGLLSDEGAIPGLAGLVRELGGAIRTAQRPLPPPGADKDS